LTDWLETTEVPPPLPLKDVSDGGDSRDHRRLVSNAGLVTILSVGNAAIGVAFQAMIAAHLGAGSNADVYAAGVSLPTVIATTFMGAFPVVLVPRIAKYRLEAPGKLLPMAELRNMLLSCTAVSLICFVGAPLLSAAVAPGFSGAKQAATTEFLRVTSPVALLAGLAATGQALAYSRARFVRSGASAAINGLGLLGATLLLYGTAPTSSDLAIAVTIGYLAQLLWMAPELLASRGGWDRRGGAFSSGAFSALAVLTAASFIYKGQPVVERTIASTVGAGSAAVMAYGLKIAQGLLIFSTGLSVVAMPSFARSVAGKDDNEAAATLRIVLTLVLLTSIVVAAYVLLSADEIVRLLFGRGNFSLHNEHRVTGIVEAYLIFLTAGALSGPVVNVHYAFNRQKWVAGIGLLGIAAAAGASLALAGSFGVVGIAVGTGIGSLVPVIVFSVKLPSLLRSWAWGAWTRSNVRMVLAVCTGLLLAYGACLILPLGLPARGNTLGLLLVLATKGALLLAGLAVAAFALRWHPRRLLDSSRRWGTPTPADAS
jgi:putative peptidoglycan lipid II flippase